MSCVEVVLCFNVILLHFQGYVSEKTLGKGSNLLGHHFQNRNSIEAKKLIDDNVVLMMKAALEKVLNNKHENRRKREVPGDLNSEFYDVESLQVRQMSFNYKWPRSDKKIMLFGDPFTITFIHFLFSRIISTNYHFHFQENAKPPGPNDESDAMFSSPYSV